MTNTQKSPEVQAAADTPQTPANLTPELVVEQLRAMVTQIPDIPALTPQERVLVRKRGRVPLVEMQAAINVVGASEIVTQAVGQPAADVQQQVVDMTRWDAVENELKSALKSVSDANLVRRQRVSLIAIQAYGVATQLARNPENVAIAEHVAEMKRLKAVRRRGKSATGASPASDAATTPKA
jgi:hypothetical protein